MKAVVGLVQLVYVSGPKLNNFWNWGCDYRSGWKMTTKRTFCSTGTSAVAGILAGAMLILLINRAEAQPIIIGKHLAPSVYVDLSVLDEIENAPEMQRLPRPGTRSSTKSTSSNSGATVVETTGVNPKTALGAYSSTLGPNSHILRKKGLKARSTHTIKPAPTTKAINSAQGGMATKTLDTQRQMPPARKQLVKVTPRIISPSQLFRINFGQGSAIIGNSEGASLDNIAKSLKQRNSLRVQLLAYAGGKSKTLSQTRRLSLSRALAVRSHLINRGVRSTRIDVRALGNKSKKGPPDRVDLIVTR